MTSAESSDFYRVLANDEGCYCIWPTDRPIPSGWTSTGFSGPREVALNQVAELWRAIRQPCQPSGEAPD